MNDKNEIVFVDTSKEVIKTLEQLSKTALRNAGKIVRKSMRNDIPIRTKRLKSHIASWARIDNKTGQPVLEVGFYSNSKMRKRGKQPSHANPHWIEEGTSPHIINVKKKKTMSNQKQILGKTVNHSGTKPRNVLRNSVYDNIDTIRSIQEELLANLNGTLEQANMKIIKSEEPEDD